MKIVTAAKLVTLVTAIRQSGGINPTETATVRPAWSIPTWSATTRTA
jgi:hypothetical protein